MNNEDEQQKNPGGRPTKYLEGYCEDVVDHMSRGYSLESFAGVCDVHKDTLYQWQKDYPNFSDAVKRGYAKSLLFWEAMGIQGAAGKIKGFNSSVYALQMANKHKWTNRTDITTKDEKIEVPVIYMPEEEKA